MTKQPRLTLCGARPRKDEVVVGHRVEGEGGPRGTVTGLQTCGSVWSCPVCSAHIRAVRATEIGAAAAAHLANGGGLLLVVLTLRHHLGERLDVLQDGLQNAWRGTVRGAPWQRAADRWGIVGSINVREGTYGFVNGWHPHANVLLFLDRPLDDDEVDQLDGWLSRRWASMVVRQGLQEPNLRNGCDVQAVRDGQAAGVYAAKVQEQASVALEMTWVESKRSEDGLYPFQILDAAGDGEADALRLWWEYEAAMKGRRCVTWSKGLRERLELGDEVADDEIVTDDQTTEDSALVEFTSRDWRNICDAGLEVTVRRALEHPDGRDAARLAVLDVVEVARAATKDRPGRHGWRTGQRRVHRERALAEHIAQGRVARTAQDRDNGKVNR